MDNILNQLTDFKATLEKKDKIIENFKVEIEKLNQEINSLKKSRKDFESQVKIEIKFEKDKSEKEKIEIIEAYECKIDQIKCDHKKLDEEQLNERFKDKISLIQEVFHENHAKKVAQRVEEERNILYEKFKNQFEEKLQQEKELLIKKYDISLLKNDVENLKFQIKNQQKSIWDPTDEELQQFIQLLQTDQNFKDQRIPNSNNVHKVVNSWFIKFKCYLPSFCKYMIYDVIKENQHNNCCQNMIIHVQKCPYIEWLNEIGDNSNLCEIWLQNIKNIPPNEMIFRSSKNISKLCEFCIQHTHQLPPEFWRKQFNNEDQLKTWWKNYCSNKLNPF